MTTTAQALTRSNTKVVVEPVDHFTGARHGRRTWTAAVTLRDDETIREDCGHEGHPTTQHAIRCATAIWKKLP